MLKLTPYKRSRSIETIAKELNRTLVGRFAYFHYRRWTICKALNANIRCHPPRLLLKRHRNNPVRLPRTHRWPNAYFAKAGLSFYSLQDAHLRFVQSVNY